MQIPNELSANASIGNSCPKSNLVRAPRNSFVDVAHSSPLSLLLKILLAFSFVALPAHADTASVLINFETFPGGAPIPDSTPITTQFTNLTFVNTTVISAFISLNETEFPPHSGNNVAFDDGGPISISFFYPALVFDGYFTYSEPLTIQAFDSGDNLLGSVSSMFSNNEAISGDPGSSPNEFLQISFPTAISSVTITADPGGGSFVMDDIGYTYVTPEPKTFYLLPSGLFLAGFQLFRKRSRIKSRHGLVVLLFGVTLALANVPALQAQTVGQPEASPKFVVAGTPTMVTVTASITGVVAASPTAVLLEQVDQTGKVLLPPNGFTPVAMNDSGMNGDLKTGDGIYTGQVNLTVPAGGIVYLTVSVGFKGKLLRVACGQSPVTAVASFLSTPDDLTPANIQTFLTNNKNTVNSAATFLQRLDPAQFKRDWIMMSATLSSQKGDAVHPRILLQNQDSKAVFGVVPQDPTNANKSLIEYIQWGDDNKFHFHSIDPAGATVTANNSQCYACHLGPGTANPTPAWPYARPNWDAYDSWGGALPFNRDRIYVSNSAPTVEQTAMQRLLQNLSQDPVVTQLDLPAGISRACNGAVSITPDPVVNGAPATLGTDANDFVIDVSYDEDVFGNVTYAMGDPNTTTVIQGGSYLVMHSNSPNNGLMSDQGRGVALFDNFTALNAQRVAQELNDKFALEGKTLDASGNPTGGTPVQLVDIRPVAYAIAGGGTDTPCDFSDLTKWAPQNVLNALLKYFKATSFNNGGDNTSVFNQTLTARHELPQIKANQEAANVSALITANGGPPADPFDITSQVAQRSAPPFGLDTLTGCTGCTGPGGPASGFMIDRELYPADPSTMQLALFRLFLQPSHEPVSAWTLSLYSTDSGVDHSATYTFGDLFANYITQINTTLGNATFGRQDGTMQGLGSGKACAELMTESSGWFAAAFAKNPGYFQ